jgi:cytochrome P450
VFEDLAGRGDLIWVDTGYQRFLLVKGADYVREMLIERSAQLVKPRSQVLETGPPSPAPTEDGIPVTEFRAALAKGVSVERAADVLSSASAAAEAERERWRDGMRLPLMRVLRRLSIATVCRATFNSRLNPDETTRAEQAIHWLVRNLPVKTAMVQRLDRLKGDRRRRRKAFAQLDIISRSLIANADLGQPSLTSAIAEDLPRLAPEIPLEQIEAMITELLIGAVDPLTQTAAWMLLHFADEQEAAARLRAEWDEALPVGQPLDLATLTKLIYTEAFVREVTRLHPTNDHITRHAVAETSLGGEHVPESTRVILNVNAVHRDARFYDQPERFAPERWLGGRPSAHKFAYVAFGVGGRRCLGETFAITALSALLPTLGRDWDFKFGSVRLSSGMRRQPAEGTRLTLRGRPLRAPRTA